MPKRGVDDRDKCRTPVFPNLSFAAWRPRHSPSPRGRPDRWRQKIHAAQTSPFLQKKFGRGILSPDSRVFPNFSKYSASFPNRAPPRESPLFHRPSNKPPAPTPSKRVTSLPSKALGPPPPSIHRAA